MQDDLRMLADEIRACTACPLHRSARQAVPGEGSAESGIFFLGEAPGYNEDLQGRPFVGAAGQLLDELLSDIGLDRSKVFITNVVRHRPPENRDPLPEEVTACDVWLHRHLAVLKPRVIVTLGRHAMAKFLRGALAGDFAALALLLATEPVPQKAEQKTADQMTLFGN